MEENNDSLFMLIRFKSTYYFNHQFDIAMKQLDSLTYMMNKICLEFEEIKTSICEENIIPSTNNRILQFDIPSHPEITNDS